MLLDAGAEATDVGHRSGLVATQKEHQMDAFKGRAYRLMFSAASLVTLAVTTGAARKFG